MPIIDTSPAAQQQLRALAPALFDSYPDMPLMAAQAAREILVKHGLPTLDPDLVYWHRFNSGYSEGRAFTGWAHNQKPTESMTLSQLVIHRFSVHDQDNADLLDGYGGFYSVGADAPVFDHTNDIALSAAAVLNDFWAINFSERYTTRMHAFWRDQRDAFRTLAKVNFLAKALQARQDYLTEQQFQTVLDAVASNLTWPPTLAGLQAEAPAKAGLRLAALDIGGHVSSDILRIIDPQGRQILYVPGDAHAFHCFDEPSDLHFWLMNQTHHSDNRARFMTHFPLSAQVQQDDTDTTTWKQMLRTPVLIYRIGQVLSGTLPPDWVDHGLNHMIDQLFIGGAWDQRVLNQADQTIDGDAFTWMTQASRTRMQNDADFSLHSNGDLRRKLWIGYLNAFSKTFGPLAMLGWPAALVVVGASVANLGLNIDLAINGKTQADREAGQRGAVFAAIDTLFNLTLLKTDGVLPALAEEHGGDAAPTFEPGTNPITDAAPPTVEMPAATLPDTPVPAPMPAKYQTNLLLEGETLNTAPGKFRQVYTLRSSNGLPQHAIMLDDQAYYVRFEADPNGNGHWAIVDPANPNGFSGSLPVRLNERGEWERLLDSNGLKGGGGNSSKVSRGAGTSAAGPATNAPPVPAIHRVTTAFDARPSIRAELKKWALDLDETHIPFRFLNVDRYTHYFSVTLRNLTQSARKFYQELSWARLPPRPNIPALEPSTSFGNLIERLPEDLPGMVISETPDHVTSTRLIIEHLPNLARKGVKTLYMRRLLNDFAQDDLNHFFQTGAMSEDLETYLAELGNDPAGQFNELQLVKAARNNGIRIQALDCATTYKNTDPLGDGLDEMTGNYLTHMIIRADTSLNGAGKWIILTGPRNLNTLNGLAGTSELQGGIGVRIEEVLPGHGGDIRIDPGIEVDHDTGLSGEPDDDDRFDTLHADLRVQVEATVLQRTFEQNRRLLFRKGMYLIDKSQGHLTLIHLSREQGVLVTPIYRLANGDVYLERPNWPSIHQVHFPSLERLSQALTSMGMKLRCRLPE